MSRNPRRRNNPIRMCSDCESITDQPILIQRIDHPDGRGWGLYACLTCAPKHLSPVGARSLWILHVADCWECNNEAECTISQALRQVFEAATEPS
ncbi:hypothetical protein [Streptomyces sp. NPDC047981]|uniref:hypothetical protein n=1 Tax=Streptomyces sp. NPDC047981 TaxID=3154610 RepID=UPI00341B45DD